MSTQTHTPTGLRSSLANAAWAVEERVVWGAGDSFRAALDFVKWPFERIAWALERGLIWPVQERTSGWDGPLRAAGLALVIVAAIGAGVAGLIWAAPDNGGEARVAQAPAPPRLPIIHQSTKAPAPPAPVLHGASPVFEPQATNSVGDISQARAKAPAKAPGREPTAAAPDAPTAKGPSSAAIAGAPAGPAAIKVAHQFANAFVLYETGDKASEVRGNFLETATPQLAHTLLKRPPRLPADVKVPKAKVLNVVAGPSHGGIYSVSVSLLRVGLTSELRLDMQQIKNKWRVTNVLG
ncbi:MAG TPA: hypothetical protein VII45_01320 [Solirubrobacterales bacterium]